MSTLTALAPHYRQPGNHRRSKIHYASTWHGDLGTLQLQHQSTPVRSDQPLIWREIAQVLQHRNSDEKPVPGRPCMELAYDDRTALMRHREHREPVWPAARLGRESSARSTKCALHT